MRPAAKLWRSSGPEPDRPVRGRAGNDDEDEDECAGLNRPVQLMPTADGRRNRRAVGWAVFPGCATAAGGC